MRDKEKRRENRCYYIRLNNYDLIDFGARGLPQLHDFVKLNLFTSHFDGVGDLVNYLKEEHYIDDNYVVENIDIVKRVKTIEDITYFKYYHVTDLPMFKDASRFFSIAAVRRFFDINFHEYEAIKFIVCKHFDIFESMLNRMNIEKKPFGVQVKYRQRLTNMSVLLEMAENMKQGFMNYLDEYTKRLNEFYDNEILYTKDSTATVNFRGLMELAKTIDEATKRFNNLVIPIMESKQDYSKNPRKPYNSPLESDEVDPDHFAFLEDEDFDNLLSDNPTQEELDSVEDQKLNIEEKKSKL